MDYDKAGHPRKAAGHQSPSFKTRSLFRLVLLTLDFQTLRQNTGTRRSPWIDNRPINWKLPFSFNNSSANPKWQKREWRETRWGYTNPTLFVILAKKDMLWNQWVLCVLDIPLWVAVDAFHAKGDDKCGFCYNNERDIPWFAEQGIAEDTPKSQKLFMMHIPTYESFFRDFLHKLLRIV